MDKTGRQQKNALPMCQQRRGLYKIQGLIDRVHNIVGPENLKPFFDAFSDKLFE